ncbi:PREDICTED: flocculation protein FLO11-like [Thamnophis sirtalis]|uniref:arylamine N-acetyltransferase n=1 Tax=Thamnophis sirtalis TaxID=35019 RepID=A0A6I9XKW9_9SAUR|nr:PREDICTED: flocculation protein FLO11-like [Thamnophis sirtalis]
MDVGCYLQRIGFQCPSAGPSLETLKCIHRSHLFSIPFESLSIHCKEPIHLELPRLYEKIVQNQRGGFCYELNGLFQWLLRALGFHTKILATHVCNHFMQCYGPPLDHLVILVDLDGQQFLCDVGFGEGFLELLDLKSELQIQYDFHCPQKVALCTSSNKHTEDQTEIQIQNQQWRSTSFQKLPNVSPAASVELGSLQNLGGPDLQKALQKYGLDLDEFSGQNAAPATESALTPEPEVKLSRGALIPISSQLQPPPRNASDSKANSHLPLDTNLRGASKPPTQEEGSVAAPLHLSESSTSVEAAIQITSITFASRRRSPSPSRILRSVLTDVSPAPDLVSPETRPANPQERQKVNSSPLQSYKACPPAGFTSEKNVASPSAKVCPPPLGSLKAARDDPRREDWGPSPEESPRRGLEPKGLVQQTDEDEHPSDPSRAEQRRYAKTLDDTYADRSNLERPLPPPKTGDVRPQNFSAGDARCAAPKIPFPARKEKTPIREDLSTSDSYLHKPRRRGDGSTPLLHFASLDCISTAVPPVSPPSPTRKALSGVHLTLSPKRVELDLFGPAEAGPEGRQVEVLKPNASDVPGPSSKPTVSKRKAQGSSYFSREASSQEVPEGGEPALHQHVQESRTIRGGVADAGTRSSRASESLKATASSQTEWMSSDAITQITTESPQKTTYSAEIFVSAENGEAPDRPKSPQNPDDTMLGLPKISALDGQAGDRPLVLPYKPPGCSEVYYVPCGKETLRISRVRSETTVESSHSGRPPSVDLRAPN